MRNLKRVLSLALALVMILGMMVMGAGAASTDFGDGAEITYVEAVDVMNALGVIEGDGTNFYPDLLLSRAEAAAIICRMLMGPENAKTLAGSVVPTEFDDVPADAWYAPYVSYCSSLGIISGDGEGHFFPTAKLTGLAFGKMLLVALGYDAKAEGYSYNEGYVGHITNDMMAAGININGVVLTDEVTRDQACQMALNTLQATLVEYETKGSSITVNGAELVFGASAAKPVTTTIAKEQTISNTQLTNTGYYTIEFAEKYFPHLTCMTTLDGMGHYAHEWLLKNDSIGRYAEEPDYTAYVTARANSNSLTKVVDNISKKFQDSTADLYINGLTEEDYVALYPYNTDNNSDTKIGTDDMFNGVDANNEYVGARGDLVEIYMDEDSVNVIDRIVVTHSTVATVGAITLTEANGTTYIDIGGVDTAGLAEYVHGYEDLSRDDVVLYYTDSENHTWIQKADSVTGIMTATTAGTENASTDTPATYTINGSIYNESRQNAYIAQSELVGWEGVADVTYYLDNAGHIIEAKGEVAPTELLLILKNYDYSVTDSVFESSKEKSQVLFLNEDAVTSIIKIAEIDDDDDMNTNSSKNDTYSLDGDTSPYTANATYDDLSNGDVRLFSYEQGRDGYDLSSMPSTSVVMATTDIVTGLPTYHTGGGHIGYNDNNWITDSKTVYLVRDVKDLKHVYGLNVYKDTFTAYVGYESVPTLEGARTVTYKGNDGVADYVVVVGYDTIASSADDLFYTVSNDITAVYKNDGTGAVAYYTVKGVLDGEIVDLKLNKDGAQDMGSAFKNKLFIVNRYDADGYVEDIVDAVTVTDNKYYVNMTGTEAAKNNVLVLDTAGTDKAFSYSDSTIVYTVGTNMTLSVGGVEDISTDGNDLVAVVTKGGASGLASNRETVAVYITKVAPSATKYDLILNSSSANFAYTVNADAEKTSVGTTIQVSASDVVTIGGYSDGSNVYTVTGVSVDAGGSCSLVNNGNGTWTVKNVNKDTTLTITASSSVLPTVSVTGNTYTVVLTGNSASASATINEIIDQLMDLGYARSEITVSYNGSTYGVKTTQNGVEITWTVTP